MADLALEMEETEQTIYQNSNFINIGKSWRNVHQSYAMYKIITKLNFPLIISTKQLDRIETVFNKFRNNECYIKFKSLLIILGQYPPHFFLRHGKRTHVINLDELNHFLRFLLNGTSHDRLSALYNYYATSQGYLTKEAFESVIKEEGGDFQKIESSFEKLTQDRFNKFFSKYPNATPMSSYICNQRFTIADEVLEMPTKDQIIFASTGIPEDVLQSSYESFVDRGEVVITKSSFSNRLSDIFQPCFITGLFNFLDYNTDGVIDIREFFQRLPELCQTPDDNFVNVVCQMFFGDNEWESGDINNEGFEKCLTQFVPNRIIQKNASRMEELRTCTLISQFSSWASENPTFQYFVKFIKITVHVVFGLPPPQSGENLGEIIMFWLQFMINKGPKLGSQWYLFSVKNWAPILQDKFSDLKLSENHNKYSDDHPVSMYDRIFAYELPRSAPIETGKRSSRHRGRSTSGELANEPPLEKAKGHRNICQRILDGQRRCEESKNEGEQSKSTNTQCRKSKFSHLSSESVESSSPHTGLTSRKSLGAGTRTPNRNWRAEDGPFIAVDRHLAERLHQWKQGKVDEVFVSSESQSMPSYLIGYESNTLGTAEEVLEVHSLEVCVHAAKGIKKRYLPREALITNIEPPKNTWLREPLPSGMKQTDKRRYFSGDKRGSPYAGSPKMKYSMSADSKIDPREISPSSPSLPADTTINNNSDFAKIPTQKLVTKPFHFAFSRCHTISEVFEAVCKYYTDYRGRDLGRDNCRMWLVISTDSLEMLTKSRTSTSLQNSSLSESDTDSTSESTEYYSSKKTTLMPIDLEIVGDQQLARYLADQEVLFHCSKQLFDPKAKCSRTFDFVIEGRVQFFLWALIQRPTKTSRFAGLKNLGNTCYMNSVIQCLRVTPKLTNEIKKYVTPNTKLAKEYLELVNQMKTSNEPLNPQSLRVIFVQKWPNFNSYDQQDAQEFLIMFLDSLNEELRIKPQLDENGLSKSYDNHVSSKRKEPISARRVWERFCADNYSPIVMFYGLCESRCKFDGCCHSSSAFDPFSSLTLPLPFNTIESLTLTVVPQFGAVPEVIRVESDKTIDIVLIREEIVRRYKCSPNCIFFVRLIGGTFKPILSKIKYQNLIQNIKNGLDEKIWAFILPEPHSDYTAGKEYTIIIQNRILVPSDTAIFEETAFVPELLGCPTVIQISTDATNKDLYKVVEKAIQRFVRSSQDPKQHNNCCKAAEFLRNFTHEGLEKCTRKCTILRFDQNDTAAYIFSIKHSDRYWLKCSRCSWSGMCRGCRVPVNSNKVELIRSEDTCVYLAVDWNLAAYVNEYEQMQENKKKIVDPVEDSDDLKMKNACPLECLLQSYFETEDASKEECITCERCNKQKCFSKSTTILVLPDVLLITLKRFQATKRGWRKLHTPVEFPLNTLDMRPYLSKEVKIKEALYDLYGVVNHAGTLNEGHYYAHIKSESDGTWFRVNDIECTELSEEEVVTPDAYVLLYQRRRNSNISRI